MILQVIELIVNRFLLVRLTLKFYLLKAKLVYGLSNVNFKTDPLTLLNRQSCLNYSN